MKKLFLKSTVIALAGIGIMAGSASADAINTNRPFDNGSLGSLQTAIDSTFGAGIIDAVNDQSNNAIWTLAEANVDSYMVTALNTVNSFFGLYSYTTGFEYQVTLGADNKFDFGINNSGDLYVDGALVKAGFGKSFGFWSQANFQNTPRTYTEDSKNNNDEVHVLTYQIADGTSAYLPLFQGGTTVTMKGDNDWLLAFEDWATNGNGDFEDLVFLVEDMNAVPEPTTMLLFGVGLIGLAGVARKRRLEK